ncbi:MAG: hypothetical protein U0610_30390 [bacterium]
MRQLTCSRPLAAPSAPYLMALVPSSWSARQIGSAAVALQAHRTALDLQPARARGLKRREHQARRLGDVHAAPLGARQRLVAAGHGSNPAHERGAKGLERLGLLEGFVGERHHRGEHVLHPVVELAHEQGVALLGAVVLGDLVLQALVGVAQLGGPIRHALLEELVGALQDLAGARSLADVGRDAARGVDLASGAQQRELDRDVVVIAIVLRRHLVELERLSRARDGEVVGAEDLGGGRREDVVVGAALGQLPRHVEELLEAAIHHHVAAVQVLHVDDGGGVVDDRLEARLALGQRVGDAPFLGDVDVLAQPHRPPGRIVHGPDGGAAPHHGAALVPVGDLARPRPALAQHGHDLLGARLGAGFHRRVEDADRLPRQLAALVAQHPREGGVGVEDAAVARPDHRHAHRETLENRAMKLGRGWRCER